MIDRFCHVWIWITSDDFQFSYIFIYNENKYLYINISLIIYIYTIHWLFSTKVKILLARCRYFLCFWVHDQSVIGLVYQSWSNYLYSFTVKPHRQIKDELWSFWSVHTFHSVALLRVDVKTLSTYMCWSVCVFFLWAGYQAVVVPVCGCGSECVCDVTACVWPAKLERKKHPVCDWKVPNTYKLLTTTHTHWAADGHAHSMWPQPWGGGAWERAHPIRSTIKKGQSHQLPGEQRWRPALLVPCLTCFNWPLLFYVAGHGNWSGEWGGGAVCDWQDCGSVSGLSAKSEEETESRGHCGGENRPAIGPVSMTSWVVTSHMTRMYLVKTLLLLWKTFSSLQLHNVHFLYRPCPDFPPSMLCTCLRSSVRVTSFSRVGCTPSDSKCPGDKVLPRLLLEKNMTVSEYLWACHLSSRLSHRWGGPWTRHGHYEMHHIDHLMRHVFNVSNSYLFVFQPCPKYGEKTVCVCVVM